MGGWGSGIFNRGRGGVVEVGEHSEGIDRGKTRGSGRRRVKTEIVLCVWVGDACRVGKDGRGNRHSDKRRRPSDRGYIAYANVNALRLREHKRCTYFSCRARFGVFIGGRGVPLRLLTRDDLGLFFQDLWG